MSSTSIDSLNRSWVRLLLAGLLGSLVGIVSVHSTYPAFAFPTDLGDYPLSPSPEFLAKYGQAQRAFHSQNYALTFALIAVCLGLPVGAVGGRALDFKAGVACGIGGAIAGALAGFGIGTLIAQLLDKGGEAFPVLGFSIEPIVQSTLLQAVAWIMISVGIMVGYFLFSPRLLGLRFGRAIQIGIIAGSMTAIVHTLVASLAFANANSFLILPRTFLERVVWVTCGGLMLSQTLYMLLVKKSNSSEADKCEL